MIESLQKMLAKGMDNPMLRFGLGKGYLDAGDAAALVAESCAAALDTLRYWRAWEEIERRVREQQ